MSDTLPRARWHAATVVAAQPTGEHGRILRLDVPDWPGSLPGQHVDVRLTAPDGYQASRGYSLATSGSGEQIELAVDRLPDGEVSPYLVDVAQTGDRIEVHGPLGGWFVLRPGEKRPVQMISGGSGVVPFVSMIRAREHAPDSGEFRLLHSVRSPEATMFRRLLMHPPAGVSVDWAYTRRAPAAASRRPGRLTDEEIISHIIPASEEPVVYACGATGFVEHVSRVLVAAGYPEHSIRLERYGGGSSG